MSFNTQLNVLDQLVNKAIKLEFLSSVENDSLKTDNVGISRLQDLRIQDQDRTKRTWKLLHVSTLRFLRKILARSYKPKVHGIDSRKSQAIPEFHGSEEWSLKILNPSISGISLARSAETLIVSFSHRVAAGIIARASDPVRIIGDPEMWFVRRLYVRWSYYSLWPHRPWSARVPCCLRWRRRCIAIGENHSGGRRIGS